MNSLNLLEHLNNCIIGTSTNFRRGCVRNNLVRNGQQNESLFEIDTTHTHSKIHTVSVFLHTHVVIPLAEYSINFVNGRQKNVDKRRSLLGISY